MTVKLPLYNIQGKNVGDLEASQDIFGIKPNPTAVHSTVVWYLACERRGTASSKTRGEVRGGGKKPWRQKGTGRARVGSIRSPLWRGGGVIFGPQPRSHKFSLPKKIRKLALKSVLSDKVNQGKVWALEDFSLNEPKTKEMTKILGALGLKDVATLMIIEKPEEKLARAASNLEALKLTLRQELNIHDLLNSAHLLVTQEAVKGFEEGLL